MYYDDDSVYDNDDDFEKEEVQDQFLLPDDLESEMADLILDVRSVLQVSEGMARILLHKFKWNKNSLLEKFYESPDTEAFLVEAQVIPKTTQPSSTGEDDCDICCSFGELTGLACNHRACEDCWKHYLTEKIMEGGSSEIECMSPDCKLLIEDEKIKSYIKDKTILDKLQRLVINSFVETNPALKWCPGKNCQKAVKVSDSEPRLISCPCGTQFCFSCCQNWHAPADCALLKKWLKKCMDDSETCNWINANTKECPKCFVPIEKNGGCNHMRCTNKSCKFEFCWMCMGCWRSHGTAGYQCNRFDGGQDANRSKHRAYLNRYLFYYNRYITHQQSLALEEKLKETVAAKMAEMELKGMAWIEVQFLKKSIDALAKCRRTLMYTYVFAFYLKKSNHPEMFENNQRDLEMATEQLSGFLERDLENEDLVTLKQKVQDLTKYVDRRQEALLEHCADGNEQDLWEFTENGV
ncbi:unnamed protein product [Caenorhabditis brenneri]